MRYVASLTLVCTLALAVPIVSADSALATYRGVTLGDSVQTVVERLKLPATDVKVVHDRPAVIQEITWQPGALISGVTTQPDSVSEIVLTFHAGQLARMAVNYDRERTKGLTNADLREALDLVYGPSLLLSTSTQRATAPASDRQTIGRWEDAETLMILWREEFPNRVGLIISAIVNDAVLQQAITDGARLHASEAPARELARRTAEAAAIQARDEKIRRDNKTKFKPN